MCAVYYRRLHEACWSHHDTLFGWPTAADVQCLGDHTMAWVLLLLYPAFALARPQLATSVTVVERQGRALRPPAGRDDTLYPFSAPLDRYPAQSYRSQSYRSQSKDLHTRPKTGKESPTMVGQRSYLQPDHSSQRVIRSALSPTRDGRLQVGSRARVPGKASGTVKPDGAATAMKASTPHPSADRRRLSEHGMSGAGALKRNLTFTVPLVDRLAGGWGTHACMHCMQWRLPDDACAR